MASPGDLPWRCAEAKRDRSGLHPKCIMRAMPASKYSPERKTKALELHENGSRGAARQTGITEEHDRLMGRRGDVHSIAPTKEQTAAATEKRVNTIETFKARAVALLAEAAELGLERTIAGVEDEKDLSKIIGVWTRAIMMVGSPIPRCADHRR